MRGQSTLVQRACQQCGCLFWVRPIFLAYGEGKYCSRACSGVGQTSRTLAQFWERLDKSGPCWLWTGALRKGYGAIQLRGKATEAHRVAWELVHGPIPEGMCVCHTCDNPRCCNPDHLWLGTVQQNSADMVAKGRSVRGERIHHARLTASTVQDIRAAVAAGATIAATARRLGVSTGCVSHVVKGRAWKHVT